MNSIFAMMIALTSVFSSTSFAQDTSGVWYCSAACVTSTGVADLRYTHGARGTFEAEARQNATEATQAQYTCNYAVAVLGCSREHPEKVYDSVAACVSSTNTNDLRYVMSGRGKSLVEAQTEARKATQAKYTCNYGVADVTHSSSRKESYCSAACVSSDGQPDLRYSKGEIGRNRSEATFKALKSTQEAFTCNYGVAITSCSAD